MTVNATNWTGDDLCIWWKVAVRFTGGAAQRFVLLDNSTKSDRRDYELMLWAQQHKNEAYAHGGNNVVRVRLYARLHSGKFA